MRIPPGWDLPVAIAARLGEHAGRQRAIIEEEHLLLILHKLPQPNSSVREGVYFWRLPTGEWRASTGMVGLIALRGHVESYAKEVAKYEALYHKAQNASEYFAVLEGIAPLHRASANMSVTLQKARETLPSVHELISLRDEASDIERVAELMQIEAKYALDFHIARQSEEQARLAHQAAQSGNRLNIIAAIFLPFTAITSLFGMNVPNGFEGIYPAPFWIILLCASFFSLMLGILLGRKS